MSKKSRNIANVFDLSEVTQQLADSAVVNPALLAPAYDDPLLQHAYAYQTTQQNEERQLSPFARATINAAFADNPAVMTAAGWEHGDDGNLHQTKFNSEDVANLNESLEALAAVPYTEMLGDVVWSKFVEPIALPYIGRAVSDARLIHNARKGAKYASNKQMPSLQEIGSAIRSGDANEKNQILGKIKAHLQPAKISIDRNMTSAKDGVYHTAPLQEISINPTSDNMMDAMKQGTAEVRRRAQYVGAHEGTHRVNDFRGYARALDDDHLKVIRNDITGPLANELEKMPDVFEAKMVRGADGHWRSELVDPRRLSSADEFVSNMTSAQMKAGLSKRQTRGTFEQLPESAQKDIYNTMKDFYDRQMINGYGTPTDAYPFTSMESFAKIYNAAVGQGFASGGHLNLPMQNTSGMYPKVAAIVEKYGVEALRNHFAGEGSLLVEDDA